MSDFQLYCFAESGNAYKAALALELTKCDWQPVFVDFFKGEARTEAFKEINEMGEVPVLIHGDVKISQSGVIQNYIADLTDKFTGSTDEERRQIQRWILWDNHKLSSQAGLLRFLMNFLPADKRPEAVFPFMQSRLKAAFTVLNTHLENREWIATDSPTMADISCCGYLYYPEPFDFDRTEWPNIDAWLDRISKLDGWQHPYDLMQRALPQT